jgi:hypothetical protein
MSLLEKLFGCSHKRFSFPQTKEGRTYVCCLKCGEEFEYDWKKMEVVADGTER